MTSRAGRRTGRTRLKFKHVDARRRAIAKLKDLEVRTGVQIIVLDLLTGTTSVKPLELPGHHLQRAAAENA